MSSRIFFSLTAGLITGSVLTIYAKPPPPPKGWNWDWDGRHEAYLNVASKQNSGSPPKGMRHVTLIRHSQYHRIQGDTNDHKSLTEDGMKQAILTGQRLRDLGLKFDRIYTSKFVRAQETAKLIVEQLPHNDTSEIIYDADLNEGLACMIEPFTNYRTRDEFIEEVRRTSPAILNGFNTYFHRRDPEKMEQDPKGTEEILIIGHGNVFRYCLLRLMQFDHSGWTRPKVLNCSISSVHILDNGRVLVPHIGDTGHLPPALLTDNATSFRL
mmetsp:Transcript_433/g.600  ORF Transcript_433/g.600 Transcript_433/m.600 type:complete len:269 (+) Transcript_433:50-856(+)|eukprot:CAMPEP_0197035894 /NCGR_PEP_ID=MMETSP1384-20130603/13554_1 /TAXON_ID=29189 /ORGANISM="Ammonia sp." /LENGTH=268 /DNA_ID=CAMNT_0042466001 /DNA_START=39 /DNA_END=845 /DNA_ORIENTATION=+